MKRSYLSLLAVVAVLMTTGLIVTCEDLESDRPGSQDNTLIYGLDDRLDFYQLAHQVLIDAAQDDLAMVSTSYLEQVGPEDPPHQGMYHLDIWAYGTYGWQYSLCSSEKFYNQPVLADCSAFIVGPDMIATAGHCISSSTCSSYAFVFDYLMFDASTPAEYVDASDVYFCSEIVSRVQTGTNDYSLVRVDRVIEGRSAPPIRRTGAVESDPNVAGLYVVGHPSGLPVKVAGGAHPIDDTGLSGALVRGTAAEFFESDLDTYGGNSGSMVFSLDALGHFLYIEGILVRGNTDFVKSGTCYVSNVCDDDTGCSGTWEEVTRATNFSHLVPPPCGDQLCESGETCLTCPADCGQCPPSVELFQDSFGQGLANWLVASPWTTTSRHSSSGYPTDGSGNPVFSAVNASTDAPADCALSFDLSTVSTATLSFWRFVDSALDYNDYLGIWFWDGSAWDQVAIWWGSGDDTNQWEYEEFPLAGEYLFDGFTFGFQTRTNRSDEFVQIDDVVLTGTPLDQCQDDGDCSDGMYCTGVETCVGGQCQDGTAPDCQDGVDCTNDSCNESTDGCDHFPDHGQCDNGSFCDGAETCDVLSGCLAGTYPCAEQMCDEGDDRCVDCLSAANCDDGLFCNGAEACVAGTCEPGTDPCPGQFCIEDTDACVACQSAADCNDDNLCTDDACIDGACSYTNNTVPCDDGLFCTVSDACSGGSCLGTGDPCPDQMCDEENHVCVDCLSAADCNDDNPCTDDACIAGACSNSYNTAPCDDGLFCTASDTCAGGSCLGAGDSCPGQMCDEIADSCVECLSTIDCVDDLFCNGTETCVAGVCLEGSYPCSDLMCDEENNACVECLSAADCHDSNPCTDDACIAGTCSNSNNTAPCDDGQFCTASDTCAGGSCLGTGDPCPGQMCDESADACADCLGDTDCEDDGNPCTDDACVAGACSYTNNTAPCDDGLFCTAADACAGGSCQGAGDACPGQVCIEETDACVDCLSADDCNDGNACTEDSCDAGTCVHTDVCGPNLWTGIVTASTNSWTTVTLDRSYNQMVVVCTPNYTSTTPPLVTRIHNASGSSFDLKLDRADNSSTAVLNIPVHCLVVEQGVYTVAEDGVTMEAQLFTSTVTDRKGSWNGQLRTYQNAYTSPVVVGQVMSYNDPDFSAFWCRGSSTGSPPNSVLRVGKHVGEDRDTTRANEVIGYIVVEAGEGLMGSTHYRAALGSDSISGVGNSPPYRYSLGGFPATGAVVSQAGMDGSEGGWAILYNSPFASGYLNLAIEEENVYDSERKHTSEQVGYLLFY